MTLPEMKMGRVLVSGAPGVRVEVLPREGEPDELVEPPLRCAAAAGASKAITSATQVLNRKKPSSIAASMKACRTSNEPYANERPARHKKWYAFLRFVGAKISTTGGRDFSGGDPKNSAMQSLLLLGGA
jgi:hypothetical protein